MTKETALICSQSDLSTDYRIHKLAQTLRSLDFEVSFLGRSCPKHAPNASPDVRVMRLLFWRGPLFYAEFNFRIFLHLLFRRRVSLVVSIDLDTLAGCTLGARLRRETLLFDSHELFPEVPEIVDKPFVKKVWNVVQDLFAARPDVRVTVCQSIADIFREKYGCEYLVVRNVPLASRLSAPLPAASSRSPLFTLLYQGAVNVGRGVEETIQALTLLPNCRLVVVGEGDVLSAAKSLASECGVADRVVFAGRHPFSELNQFMAAADLGLVFMRDISLNYRLALPNRLFDFIQAGLPILGNRLPEISRIIEGDDVGLCIGELAPQAIADAVARVMASPDDVARWKNNMSRLRTSLTWENETLALQKSLSEIFA